MTTMIDQYLQSHGPELLAFSLFVLTGLALLSMAFVTIGRRNRQVQARLGTLLAPPIENTPENLPVRDMSFLSARSEKLEKWRENLRAKAAYLVLGLIVGLAALYPAVRQSPLITLSVVLCLTLLAGAGGFVLLLKRQRRRALFIEQLPEAIDIIIRGARVGMSLQENFQVIAREMPDPIGREFRILSEKLSIGIELEAALNATLSQLRVKELQFMATTLILQRRTGGQYGEVLENLNAVLRDRQAQYLKARALTSEARVSARIVTGVTAMILLILALTNKAQFNFLMYDPSGRHLLIYCGLSILTGFFVISRLLGTLK